MAPRARVVRQRRSDIESTAKDTPPHPQAASPIVMPVIISVASDSSESYGVFSSNNVAALGHAVAHVTHVTPLMTWEAYIR